MSKGNKESKKPKRVVPLSKVPLVAVAAPPLGSGFKPKPGKR